MLRVIGEEGHLPPMVAAGLPNLGRSSAYDAIPPMGCETFVLVRCANITTRVRCISMAETSRPDVCSSTRRNHLKLQTSIFPQANHINPTRPSHIPKQETNKPSQSSTIKPPLHTKHIPNGRRTSHRRLCSRPQGDRHLRHPRRLRRALPAKAQQLVPTPQHEAATAPRVRRHQ